MPQMHYKSAFQGIDEEELTKWLKFNKTRLIGSAIFTCQDSLTSKLVRWGERHLFAKPSGKTKFVPSHTGSIIEYMGELCIFDMKPLRASVQPLKKYLLYTDEDYCLVLRDFPLDTVMFSLNLQFHIGDWYPYMSALRSVFTKRKSKNARHCSECHIIELQKQGIYKELNPEITPDELFQVLKKDWEGE